MTRRAVLILLIIVPLFTMATWFAAAKSRDREATAHRNKCLRQLRALGQAILMYANENHGLYPPDLRALRRSQDISLEFLCCPAMHDAHATESNPDHADYIYLNWSKFPRSDDWQTNPYPVLYDRSTSYHQGRGINILFADGSVYWDENGDRLREFARAHPDVNVPPPR